MRLLAVALACAALLEAPAAEAFVTPRYTTARDRGRKALIGTWRAVTFKTAHGAQVIDPGITIVFDKTTLRVEAAGKAERATWRVVDQDGDIVELEVTDAKGKRHDVDVLIESNTALTLYIEDADGDDEEVMRVERLD